MIELSHFTDDYLRRLAIRVQEELSKRSSMNSMSFTAGRVAAKHCMTVDDLKSPARTKEFCEARHEAMHEMRSVTRDGKRPRYSLPQIGRFFNRDHTTVINGIRKHEQRRSTQA